MKVLLLPFLQMPSGHHHVADAISDALHASGSFVCEKVDVFSYAYNHIEGLTSKFYIKWINYAPSLYNAVYEKAAYKSEEEFQSKRFPLYERLFLEPMERLIHEKKPEMIICTHGLPSYLLNRLKLQDKIAVPVINVYTDYFVNQLWGMEKVDVHFAPCPEIKDVLVKRNIDQSRIFVTGIPIHSYLKEQALIPKGKQYTVIISGGNMGTGSLKSFIQSINPSGRIHYIVLCGKNQKLYKWVRELSNRYIHAYPYVASKREMNSIYCSSDAVITKPGGVTVSECLYKKLPIMVYDELPGQEQVNLRNLKNWGLIYHLEGWRESVDVETRILQILQNEEARETLNGKLNVYHEQLHKGSISDIIGQLKGAVPKII